MVSKNRKFTLPVPEGRETVLIGSDVEPVEIGRESHYDEWDNGPTTYCREYRNVWYLVVQDGRPIIIRTDTQHGAYADEEGRWEAYDCPHLPSGRGVDRGRV